MSNLKVRPASSLALGHTGDAASRIRILVICQGANSRLCPSQVDEKMTKSDASASVPEREKLLQEVPEPLIDNQIMIPNLRPGVPQRPEATDRPRRDEIIGAIPQYGYPGPL